MKIIEHLSDQIADEIECAEEYAKCALAKKEDYPQLAETYYRISSEKMTHMGLLHTQVANIIADYKKIDSDYVLIRPNNKKLTQTFFDRINKTWSKMYE